MFSGRRVVLDATLSSLLACCTKCVCLWLLSCPGVDRRCGRCHLSPCLLLRHLETLWSPPREVQLAAAGPRCALLPPEARAGRVHLPPVSGMALLSCTSGLGQNASVQKVPFPPENPLSPKKFPFPPENPFPPRKSLFPQKSLFFPLTSDQAEVWQPWSCLLSCGVSGRALQC